MAGPAPGDWAVSWFLPVAALCSLVVVSRDHRGTANRLAVVAVAVSSVQRSPALPAAPGALVNVRLTGAHTGPAALVGVNSLTLAGGASLTLSDTLSLNTGSLFAEGAGAAVTGGTLAFSAAPGFGQLGVIGVAQGGDLTIGSTLADVARPNRGIRFTRVARSDSALQLSSGEHSLPVASLPGGHSTSSIRSVHTRGERR